MLNVPSDHTSAFKFVIAVFYLFSIANAMRVWLYLYFTMFFSCLSIGTERGTKFPQIVQKEGTAFVQVHNENKAKKGTASAVPLKHIAKC